MRKLILLISSLFFLGVPLSSNGLSFYYSMNFKSEIYYTPFFTQNLEIDPAEGNKIKESTFNYSTNDNLTVYLHVRSNDDSLEGVVLEFSPFVLEAEGTDNTYGPAYELTMNEIDKDGNRVNSITKNEKIDKFNFQLNLPPDNHKSIVGYDDYYLFSINYKVDRNEVDSFTAGNKYVSTIKVIINGGAS